MLEQERAFYDQHLPEWLEQCPGRVALIKGQQLIGFFDVETDALREGARRFGLESFLVRRVEPAQQEVVIPALTLGLINANPTYSVHRSGGSA